MTKLRAALATGAALMFALSFGYTPAFSQVFGSGPFGSEPIGGGGHKISQKEEYGEAGGHGKSGYGGRGHGAMGSHGMGMMHSSTGHLIRHLLKHEKDIGLTADQVAKLKDIQLNLDKTRIRAEADIQVAERELKALTDEEKSDLGAIEAKLKQSEDMQVALRMTSIKTRRDVLALLSPEQRAKEKAEHEKMLQQHKEGRKGQGSPHSGGMMNPHGGAMGGNPPKGAGAPPTPPSDMKVQ